MDTYEIIEDVVNNYGPRLTAALRAEARNSGLQRQSGRLFRGFTHKVRKNNLEVWGVSFTLPRYGYIQNAGIEPGTIIQTPKSSSAYRHPGLRARGFIGTALDQHVDDMFREITARVGDGVLGSIRL